MLFYFTVRRLANNIWYFLGICVNVEIIIKSKRS